MATKNKRSGASLLIFLSWLMYMSSYLGKVNYSANINGIMEFYGVTKPEAGIVPTFFFFAYGVGQVVNGILCKKYNIKWMIFGSLMTSAAINLIIAVSSDFSIIKWLWLVNGFALSVLWPTLIRLLSENLPKKDLGRSSVIMGTTVGTGTLIIYGLSALYTELGNFKLAFFTAAVSGITVSIVWLFLYNHSVSRSREEMSDEDLVAVGVKATYTRVEQTKLEKNLFLVSIYVLCFCAVGVNLVKDGLTTWVPTILKEEYAVSSSLSILLTLTLPIVAIFANAFAVKVHNKIPDYVTHCAVIFAIIGCVIAIVIGALSWHSVLIMFACLVIAAFFASSLNSLITSVFPMFMRGKVNSGLFAGILNGFCYLGSTISSYGLGVAAENYGWTAAFVVLIAFCVAVCIIWAVFSIIRHILTKKTI